MDSRGLTFIYVDYGDLDRMNLELRYSLATLLYWKFHAPVDVVVYTDKPDLYRDLPVRVIDLAPRKDEFSRGGLYHHRIKPCVLLEEMKINSNICVMSDTDAFFQGGFFEKLWSVVNAGSAASSTSEKTRLARRRVSEHDRFAGQNTFVRRWSGSVERPVSSRAITRLGSI